MSLIQGWYGKAPGGEVFHHFLLIIVIRLTSIRKEDKRKGREGEIQHTLDGDLRVICVYNDHGGNLCGAEERYGGEGVGKLVALAHGTEYRSARLFFV